uniref:Uncharacterized protein n=1 Tax=Salix viminalis TaxID=40686 RepID=A0A6N2M9P9_SALVM
MESISVLFSLFKGQNSQISYKCLKPENQLFRFDWPDTSDKNIRPQEIRAAPFLIISTKLMV